MEKRNQTSSNLIHPIQKGKYASLSAAASRKVEKERIVVQEKMIAEIGEDAMKQRIQSFCNSCMFYDDLGCVKDLLPIDTGCPYKTEKGYK